MVSMMVLSRGKNGSGPRTVSGWNKGKKRESWVWGRAEPSVYEPVESGRGVGVEQRRLI